ncbi:nuclear transport factor 2 family protein [Bradyrhizobium sp.]|uniref:nuclear transport factor 2 family protein n=1 Tax=Bradyrhizobium sp. TaxID=376 RepID=UPI000ACEDE33|nr:nuclear transport factor 2 family protein [Bradyrhizobium sp.]
MSSFDPMGAALDWLDAYRARDISIIDLYAGNAALECNCHGQSTVGRAALCKYWRQRFAEKPAGALAALTTNGGDVVICYAVPDGVASRLRSRSKLVARSSIASAVL